MMIPLWMMSYKIWNVLLELYHIPVERQPPEQMVEKHWEVADAIKK